MSLRSQLARPFHCDLRPGETARLPAVDVTVLFCDIVGSTELTRRLGDRGAYSLIRHFLSVIQEWIVRCAGEALELRGDGALLAFSSPRAALECAVGIQREIARDEQFAVRMGLHTGCALRLDRGYFGQVLILAARIADHAQPSEILVSSELAERLEDPSAFPVCAERSLELKGFARHVQVLNIDWQGGGPVAGRESHGSRDLHLPLYLRRRLGAATDRAGILAS